MPAVQPPLPTIPFQQRGLYFLHIPKTAGTSVRYWLHELFSFDDWLPCHTVEEVDRMDPAAVKQAPFLSGHFGWNILERIDTSRPVITWLRDPVKRLISNYVFNRTCFDELVQIAIVNQRSDWVEYYEAARKMSLVELIRSDFHLGFNDNLQTRYLAGIYPQTDQPVMIDDSILATAKQRLSQLDFVGICEWMSASIDLLCYQLCAPYRPLTMQFNSSGADGKQSRLELTEAEQQALQQSEQFDVQLYQFGQKLFNQRFETFWQVFTRANAFFKQGIPDFPDVPPQRQQWLKAYDRISPKVLVQRLINRRFQKQSTKQPVQTTGSLDFRGPVYGTGWHPRFEFHGQYLRWSGPGCQSTIFLPLQSGHDYRVEFVMRVVANYKYIESLRIKINGIRLKHEFNVRPIETGVPRAVDFVVEIPRQLVQTDGPWTEIEFTVDGPLTIADSVPPSLVSFATDGFRYTALPQNQTLQNALSPPHFSLQSNLDSAMSEAGSP